MLIKLRSLAFFACLAGPALAEDPLVAIDWLKEFPITRPAALEPPVAPTGDTPGVEVKPLRQSLVLRTGLLPKSVTGLPPDLWNASDPQALIALLRNARIQRLPAGQELLLLLTLAEADEGPDFRSFLLERIDTLIFEGAVEPAKTLVDQANPTSSAPVFDRWMTLSLLTDTEESACSALRTQPNLTDDTGLRVFCAARLGDFETAALLFGNAAVLGIFSKDRTALLEAYLDPELFDIANLPRAPVRPDALTFRLYKAVGAPLPSAPLQRAFAHQDLSSEAGWKARLEAAERLARAGVLPGNQLLGLYTRRKPAASGGIWDRIAALQSFESALNARDANALEQTLPPMWRSMRAAELEVLFSGLFADDLAAIDLLPNSAQVAYWMTLLSDNPLAARAPANADARDLFLGSVAAGKPDPQLAKSGKERAVVRGFQEQSTTQADQTQIGERLLRVLVDLSAAGRGDTEALSDAIAALREDGFDTLSRKVALQSLLLLGAR